MPYAQHVSKRKTSQRDQASPKQVKNSAGGFSFKQDDWGRLRSFLILGNEGGSYYASEKQMTKSNVAVLDRCYAENPKKTVDTIVAVSVRGLAPKNDPAVFALAYLSHDAYALSRMAEVCRIGTHLFQFLEDVKQFRGWGRTLKRAVSNWYTSKTKDDLIYQVLKYRNRNGWTHRDALRKAHPVSDELNNVFKWIVGKMETIPEGLEKIVAFEELQTLTKKDKNRAVELIREHNMVRECIPTELLNEVEVWESLLEKMPLTAMIRNLGKMTSVGLIKPLSSSSKLVASKLSDADYLRKSRIHPLSVLVALSTYQAGRGIKGSLTWFPVGNVVDALDAAFYKSFDFVEPTNKNYLLGIDVSGSMSWGKIAGTHITPNIAAAAMAMTTLKTEPNCFVHGFSDRFRDLKISQRDNLQSAMSKTQSNSFGRTDCALPMVYALENGLDVDVFVVYTDNETYAGSIHPHQALREYREKKNPNAKAIVVGMVSNGFSVLDPEDPGSLQVVGFDTAAPSVMANFVRGDTSRGSLVG